VPSQPNIVLFITHDTGRHVSPYGVKEVNTPNCEALAAQSVRFSQSFCTCPLSSPSRASCVTGRYPHQNGVMGLTSPLLGGWDLNPGERHAARIYADNGYDTVLCGFEHETPRWDLHGFGAAIAGNRKWFNGEGDLLKYDRAMDDWLTSRPDNGRPFYMQIGCHETHHAWTRHGTPPDDSRGLWMPPYLRDLPELRREMAEFQGAVRRMDTGLGLILDVLDRRGLRDDTIFVFTTDHGIDVPRAKGTFYDPGIEVFQFMRYPAGGWGAGRVIDPMVSNIDVLPTLLEACGIEGPKNLAGRSMLPLLDGCGTYQPRDAIFAEKTFHDSYDPTRAIRTARYKYVRYFEACIFQDLRLATSTRWHYFRDRPIRSGVEELYDLSTDPHELTNLADDPVHAAAKDGLRRRLVGWMRETDDPLLRGPIASPSYRKALEAFLA
jgi:arylsulfatase A-like enzyme